jgi:hypothetical protein
MVQALLARDHLRNPHRLTSLLKAFLKSSKKEGDSGSKGVCVYNDMSYRRKVMGYQACRRKIKMKQNVQVNHFNYQLPSPSFNSLFMVEDQWTSC